MGDELEDEPEEDDSQAGIDENEEFDCQEEDGEDEYELDAVLLILAGFGKLIVCEIVVPLHSWKKVNLPAPVLVPS